MSNSLRWAVISCHFILHFDTQNFKVCIDFRKKMSNIKIHKNPSTGSRAVPYGQTDNEANSRLSQFWEMADERSLKELLFRVAQRGVLFTGTAYKRRQQESVLRSSNWTSGKKL